MLKQKRSFGMIMLTISTITAVVVSVAGIVTMTAKPAIRPFAEVRYSGSDVRRKHDKEVFWDHVESGSEIFTGDKVKTGDESGVQLEALDGTDLKFSEKSSFLIDTGELYSSIHLENGRLFLSGRSAVSVATRGAVLKTRGGNFVIEQSETGSLSASAFRGAMTIQLSADGKDRTITLAANESITIDPQGENVQIAKLPFLLENPADSQVVDTFEKQSDIELRWTQGQGMAAWEIAKDNKFVNVLKSGKSDLGRAVVRADPGVYYWRLTNERGERAASSRFVIAVHSAPTLLRSRIDEFQPIRFAWKVNREETAGGARFKVELSKSSAFSGKKIVITDTARQMGDVHAAVLDSPARLADLLEGSTKVYWRVVIEYPASGVFAQSRVGAIELRGTDRFSAPTPLFPRDRSEHRAEKGHVTFSWKSVPGALEYRLYIWAQGAERLPEPTLVSTVNHVVYDLDETRGNMNWSVVAVGPHDELSGFSRKRVFRTIASSPKKLSAPASATGESLRE